MSEDKRTVFEIIVDSRDSQHTHFRIFAGLKEGLLGLCGKLCMRNNEFMEFIERLGEPSSKSKFNGERQKYIFGETIPLPPFSNPPPQDECKSESDQPMNDPSPEKPL